MYVDNCAAQRRRDPACGRQSKLRILMKGRALIISGSVLLAAVSIFDGPLIRHADKHKRARRDFFLENFRSFCIATLPLIEMREKSCRDALKCPLTHKSIVNFPGLNALVIPNIFIILLRAFYCFVFRESCHMVADSGSLSKSIVLLRGHGRFLAVVAGERRYGGRRRVKEKKKKKKKEKRGSREEARFTAGVSWRPPFPCTREFNRG